MMKRWLLPKSSNTFVNIVNVCPDLIDRAVVLNGVSKAYSMTGWRIGYTAGPESLIKAMKKIQSQSTSNPTSISQAAAVAALNGPQDCITDMLGHFKDRHDFMVTELNKISGIECMPTDGTFYVFPKVEGLVDAIDGVANDLDLAEYLITSKAEKFLRRIDDEGSAVADEPRNNVKIWS